jgi:hypothetical protein
MEEASEASKSRSSSTRIISDAAETREVEPLPGAQESDPEIKPTDPAARVKLDSSSTYKEEVKNSKPKPLIGNSAAGQKCCLLV